MSEKASDSTRDVKLTINKLHRMSLVMPVVVAVAFVSLGIVVQNWAIVAGFTIFGLAVVALWIALARKR